MARGFEAASRPFGKAVVNRGDDACPIDGANMNGKSILARIPRQTYTEIRRVCISCVPVDSPNYEQALELAAEKGI